MANVEKRKKSGCRRAEDIEEEIAVAQEDTTEFDPSDTCYDFIAQTGITPGSSE